MPDIWNASPVPLWFLIVKGTSNLLFADIVEQMQSLFLKNGENVSTYYIDEDANEVNYAIQLCRDRNPKGIVFLGGNLEYFKEDLPTSTSPAFYWPTIAVIWTLTIFLLWQPVMNKLPSPSLSILLKRDIPLSVWSAVIWPKQKSVSADLPVQNGDLKTANFI